MHVFSTYHTTTDNFFVTTFYHGLVACCPILAAAGAAVVYVLMACQSEPAEHESAVHLLVAEGGPALHAAATRGRRRVPPLHEEDASDNQERGVSTACAYADSTSEPWENIIVIEGSLCLTFQMGHTCETWQTQKVPAYQQLPSTI